MDRPAGSEDKEGRRAPSGRSPRLRSLLWAAVILAAIPGLSGPSPASPVQTAPAAPAASFPSGHTFRLEVARSPEERARGYMFREKVGPREGMLLLFPRDGFHSIWMKNCRVPLDLIWLSAGLRVVHLEKSVPPCRRDPCPGYPPMRKARMVLEIRGGMAEKTGLRVGDSVRLEGVEVPVPGTP